MKPNRWIAFALAFLLLFTPVAAEAAAIRVERVAGSNRYETSLKVTRTGFPYSFFAFVAGGDSFADALVGGQAAGHYDAPLLITREINGGADPELVDLLFDMDVQSVIIVGGTGSLSKAVEEDLAKHFQVLRIQGKDRFETADRINAMVYDAIRGLGPEKYYANGYGFADALVAVPYVYGGLLYLVDGKTPVKDGIAIGGPASVPGTPKQRIGGANRYDTAAKMAEGHRGTILLVSGENFPDALSATAFATRFGFKILLTPRDRLAPETKKFLQTQAVKKVIVIGGSGSVSDAVIQEIEAIEK